MGQDLTRTAISFLTAGDKKSLRPVQLAILFSHKEPIRQRVGVSLVVVAGKFGLPVLRRVEVVKNLNCFACYLLDSNVSVPFGPPPDCNVAKYGTGWNTPSPEVLGFELIRLPLKELNVALSVVSTVLVGIPIPYFVKGCFGFSRVGDS